MTLKMPHTYPCARKISDDLKWGQKLHGTHDDHVGLQKVAMNHHAQHNIERIPQNLPGKGVPPMEVRKVREGQTPAVLKKK